MSFGLGVNSDAGQELFRTVYGQLDGRFGKGESGAGEDVRTDGCWVGVDCGMWKFGER